MKIAELQKEAHRNSVMKGWWDDVKIPLSAEQHAVKIALIHSEASEALEAVRRDQLALFETSGGKPEGLPSELADIMIRVADYAEAAQIDLTKAIETKMAYNETRPHRHGGKSL